MRARFVPIACVMAIAAAVASGGYTVGGEGDICADIGGLEITSAKDCCDVQGEGVAELKARPNATTVRAATLDFCPTNGQPSAYTSSDRPSGCTFKEERRGEYVVYFNTAQGGSRSSSHGVICTMPPPSLPPPPPSLPPMPTPPPPSPPTPPSAPPSPFPPGAICEDTCEAPANRIYSFPKNAKNGKCEDGSPPAADGKDKQKVKNWQLSASCLYGTDCTDCGIRYPSPPSAPPSAPPPPPPPAPPPPPPTPKYPNYNPTAVGPQDNGGGDGGDAPCFGKADTYVTLADGSSVLMAELVAGDLVKDGTDSVTRVIVNQHRAAELSSSLVTLEWAAGALSLTPDHVLEIDGKMAAAREAVVGSKLGDAEVARVSRSTGKIINPLTASGKIEANGVLAATYPEWIAHWMLDSTLYPLPLSLGNALSLLFPLKTQGYYDNALEPLMAVLAPKLVALKAALPAPLVVGAVALADGALSAGFAAYTLADLKMALAASVLLALFVTKSRKA